MFSVDLKHCASSGADFVKFDRQEPSSGMSAFSFATERASPETRGRILVSLGMWGGTCRGGPPHLLPAYIGEEVGDSIDFSSLGLFS